MPPRNQIAAIISKPQKPEMEEILPPLVAWLGERGYECLLDPESAYYLARPQDAMEREEMPAREPGVVRARLRRRKHPLWA
jgi:NAD+ kinase